MSDLKQREKLLQQAKIEAQALQTLIRSKNLLIRNHWFNQDQRKGEICAQMAISEAGTEINHMAERQKVVKLAMDLLLEEAQTIPPSYGAAKEWVSIPHWNDAQKYKKDVLKVFNSAIVNLQKKLQPV